jgi:hypothetical protein
MIAAAKRDLQFGPVAIATRFCLMVPPPKRIVLAAENENHKSADARFVFALALILAGKQNTDS